MFFTTLARVLAVVALLFAIIAIGVGVANANGWVGGPGTFTQHYWPTLSPGQMFDRGVYTLVFAVVLGTIAEIALGVRRLVKDAASRAT